MGTALSPITTVFQSHQVRYRSRTVCRTGSVRMPARALASPHIETPCEAAQRPPGRSGSLRLAGPGGLTTGIGNPSRSGAESGFPRITEPLLDQ